MTRDDIIRMAREAGFEIDCCSLEWHDRIERFAALVAAAEREACAKVCEKEMEVYCGFDKESYAGGRALTSAADAIRARGQA